MTAHASSIAEYWRVVLDTNFTLGSGITQYASTNLNSQIFMAAINRCIVSTDVSFHVDKQVY